MNQRRIHNYPVHFVATLVASIFFFGCATPSGSVNEKFDQQTGVTVLSSNTPLIMYRDNPARAAYARNYLHVGPVLVNRSGNYEYYLWVGIWNTMQPAGPIEQADGFDSIVLFVDGQPLLFDVSGWTPASIGVSEPVYTKPVASSLDAYYRVTEDQVRLIAESSDLRLRTTGATPRDYEQWDDQRAAKKGLHSFLDRQ